MLWFLSQLLFLPLSGVISIGLRFFALLAFTIVGFFAVIQLYGKSISLWPVMKLYLLSYVFVGLFGLFQFATPLVGLPGILVQQWLSHGKVARISGFSYEPSYYVTYLIMGWVMLVELRISGAKITSGRLWKWATVALTFSVICSSSKTAYIVVAVELFARILPKMWGSLRGALMQASQGRMVVRIPGRSAMLNAVLVVGVIAGFVYYVPKLIDPLALLSGSGLAGTPAHSLNDRSNSAIETFDAFMDAPLVGRSLGGVPIYRAARQGIEIHTMEELRFFWGFPVVFEVFVASGLFGGIVFLVFVYANTFGALRTAKMYWPSERAKWLRALARGMIFECLLLTVDQNLLRVYVWLHVTMVTLVAYNLEFGTAAEPVVEASPSRFPRLLEAMSNT
jgi:hypothetical protein